MENKLTNIKERILYVAEKKEVAKENLCKKIGMSYAAFKGEAKKRPINSDAIVKLLTIYPDLSVEWLMSGEGSMIKTYDYKQKQPEASRVSEKESKYIKNKIPHVSISAIAGFGNSRFSIKESDVKDYYVVPKFKDKRIDFMIEVSGSSMLPKYSAGDVVACTILKESQFIQWNKAHVIGTEEQGILIKRIKKGTDDSNLLLVSDNKDYDPFLIGKDEITGMALIVGVIRLE